MRTFKHVPDYNMKAMLSRPSIHVKVAAPSGENMKDVLIDIISERNLPGLLQDSRETFLTRARAELRVHIRFGLEKAKTKSRDHTNDGTGQKENCKSRPVCQHLG